MHHCNELLADALTTLKAELPPSRPDEPWKEATEFEEAARALVDEAITKNDNLNCLSEAALRHAAHVFEREITAAPLPSDSQHFRQRRQKSSQIALAALRSKMPKAIHSVAVVELRLKDAMDEMADQQQTALEKAWAQAWQAMKAAAEHFTKVIENDRAPPNEAALQYQYDVAKQEAVELLLKKLPQEVFDRSSREEELSKLVETMQRENLLAWTAVWTARDAAHRMGKNKFFIFCGQPL